MKYLILIPALGMLFSSCGSQGGGDAPSLAALKGSIVAKGTLANASVEREASSTVRTIGGGSARISQYVIKQPSGREGSKTWRELWVYNPGSQEKNFMIDFKEDGRGSANFEIEEL